MDVSSRHQFSCKPFNVKHGNETASYIAHSALRMRCFNSCVQGLTLFSDVVRIFSERDASEPIASTASLARTICHEEKWD